MADSPAGTLGPINWGSNVVNGQLVPQAPTSAFYPKPVGGGYTNPRWGSTSPYGVPPVIPSPAMAAGPVGQATIAPTQAGSYSGNSGAWHPTKGTLAFGFFALVAGLFMLHYIHYGGGK